MLIQIFKCNSVTFANQSLFCGLFKLYSVKTLAIHLSSCCSNQHGSCLPAPVIFSVLGHLVEQRGPAFHVLKESTTPPQVSAVHSIGHSSWLERIESIGRMTQPLREAGEAKETTAEHSGYSPKTVTWVLERGEERDSAGWGSQLAETANKGTKAHRKQGGAAGEPVWCFWLSSGSPNLVLPTHPLEQIDQLHWSPASQYKQISPSTEAELEFGRP